MDKKIIHTVFEQVAIDYPNKIAVQDAEGQITYQKLNTEANQLARWLKSLQIEKGDIIGVLNTPGIGLIKSLLAILKSGGIYLPVDVDFPTNRIAQIFNDCCPKVLFVDKAQLPRLQEWIDTIGIDFQYVICLGNQGWALYQQKNNDLVAIKADISSFEAENLPVESDKDDGNYIFYTSGSTGEAKAILGRHKSLGHFIDWEIREFELNDSNQCAMLSQFTFDASLRDIFVPLCTGSTLHIPSLEVKNNTARLLEWLVDHKISLIHTVPSVFKLLTIEISDFDRKAELGACLNHLLMAGEPLYVKDIKNWRALMGDQVEIVNLYGTSETTLAKTCHRIKVVEGEPGQLIHVGQPISHTQVMIMNGPNLCSTGEIGEIFIRTPFISKGYFNNEALTASVFVQNPLGQEQEDLIHRTGDFGRYLSDGEIEVLGRKDDQVKVNGIRVELGEVICRIREIEGVEDTDVIAVQNELFGNDLVCYYTGKYMDETSWQAQLKDRLPKSIVPSFFIHLDEFPLTVNGKKDKKSYPRPETILTSDDQYEAPVGQEEQKLEEIWKEILGMKRISRNVSFFKLGGNSMKVIQLTSRIFREYGISFKYADIFKNHSIRSIAKLIADSQNQMQYASIKKIVEQEYHELSLSQHQLYVACQFERDQIAYNIPVSYVFEGKLDLSAFVRAFDQMVDRHESLRTTFHVVDGELKQKIHDCGGHEVKMDLIDLIENPDPMEVAETLARNQATTVFDLAQGPLLKASIIKVGPEKHVFALTMHHIISDGWSMNIIIHELLTMYNAFKANLAVPLAPLSIQYKDYAAWQRESLQTSGSTNDSKQYWTAKFEGDLPILELPLDYERPEFADYKGSAKNYVFDSTRTSAIKKTCEDAEVTLFMFLLSMVNILLLRRTGQEDIVLGSPIAGRPHNDLEDQIGFYVNMLAFRTKLDPAQSFSQLLHKVKANTLEAYDHELYPFHQIVEDLNLEADFSRNNLFDVVVQFQNAKLEKVKSLKLDDIEVTNFLPNAYSSKFDITFNFEEIDSTSELSLDIEYKSSLFREETVDGLFDELAAIADLVTDNPKLTINEIREGLIGLDTNNEDSNLTALLAGGVSSDY